MGIFQIKIRQFSIVVFLVLLTEFLANQASAQIVDNRINLYFSKGILNPFGNSIFKSHGFESASLFNNYTSNSNICINVNYKINQFISTGLSYKNWNFENWRHNDYLMFYGTNTSLHIFSPTFIFHTKYNESGLFNKLRFSYFLEPLFYSLKVRTEGSSSVLGNQFIDIKHISDGSEISTLSEYRFFSFGISTGLKMEYSLFQNIGAFVRYGINYLNINEHYYIWEKSLYVSNFEFGVMIRLLKDKTIY